MRWQLVLSGLAAIAPVLAIPSDGCATALPAKYKPGAASRTFKIDSPAGGGYREALVHLPKNYAHGKPAKLLLAYHGKNQDVADFETVTGFSDPAVNADTIVVYPEALDGMWTGDPEAPSTKEVNDIDYTSDLLDFLESTFCIDRGRIYATGFSNGGGLAGLLACHPFLSQRIAAFAAVSGAFHREEALQQPLFDYCAPGRTPVAFMTIHGDTDNKVDYLGVLTKTISIPRWLDGWRERNYCKGSKGEELNIKVNDSVDMLVPPCSNINPKPVIGYALKDVGHVWHRGTFAGTEQSFDTTAVILEFLKQHKIRKLVLEIFLRDRMETFFKGKDLSGSDEEDDSARPLATSTQTIRMTVESNTAVTEGEAEATVRDEL